MHLWSVLSVLLLCTCAVVHSLSCLQCDQETCTDTSNCPGEVVFDICGCCEVCAKVEGEPCGGAWNNVGVCDSRFFCNADASSSFGWPNMNEGVCVPCPKLDCTYPCEYGTVTQKNGCPSCQCRVVPKEPDCVAKLCHFIFHCTTGYEVQNGCKSCRCNGDLVPRFIFSWTHVGYRYKQKSYLMGY